MKDDPRDFDWAPNQIEELKDRVKRLERQTEFEASEDNDRIKAMEAAVRELQSAVASMRSQQDFMIGEGHGEPFEVWCRRKINGLAHAFTETDRMIGYMGQRLDRIENQGSKTVTELESRVSALEGHPRRDPYDSMKGGVSDADEFMASPVVVETSEQIEERRRVLVESMKDRRVTFDPAPERKLIGPPHAHLDAPCTEACYEPVNTESGPPAGWVQAEDGAWSSPATVVLNQAEARVRDYLGNLDLDPDFTAGVVRAVRGVVADGDLPKSTFLDRRDVDEREAAKVVGTKCPGSPQCWAVARLHWHDRHGVVHNADPGKGS